MKITYEHYRVPERCAPLIPKAKHTQAAIDDLCERYDEAYRAEFRVPVEYREDNGPIYRPGTAPHTHGGKTVCKIYTLKTFDGHCDPGYEELDWELVATGTAWCSINDPFSYRVGRAIARGRALKVLEEAL